MRWGQAPTSASAASHDMLQSSQSFRVQAPYASTGGWGGGTRCTRTRTLTRRVWGVTPRVQAVLAPANAAATEAAISNLKSCRLITAIKTPYLPNGKFDLEAYDSMVEHQIANGVEGLIVGGTTGEGQLMSWDEHIMLIAHTVNQFGRQIKVIGNTGSNSTREALHATEQGFAVGMDAALQINPYYGKTSMTGLKEHFKAVLAEGPAIIYNVPGRTGQDIPDDVIMAIASHENFLGVKECTGNARIERYFDSGVLCWSGNDDESHAGRHQHHAQGVISVASNIIPGLFSKMMHQRDDQLAASLQDLIAWLFCEPNPIPLNTALAMCGLVRPVFRLPYVPLSREEREKGAVLLDKVKEHIPGCKEVIRPMDDSEFKLVANHQY